MNADAFRQFYEYHFSENRKLWDCVTQLSDEQFTQNVDYSRGSVREQIFHLIDVDDAWFNGLRNAEPSDALPHTNNLKMIREYWDKVEQKMCDYLAELQDDMLFTKPIVEPEEDKKLIVWQVLLHVVNHGTDHRAQLLRVLNDLRVKTMSQDYIFYVYENL